MRTVDVSKLNYIKLLIVFFMTIVFAGCSDRGDLPAAPFGDLATLEKLAKSYEVMAGRIPVSPTKIKLEDKKQFVANVFAEAGYSYRKTLLSSAAQQKNIRDKHHRDLADLMLLPTKGLNAESLSELYDADELVAVAALKSSTN